MLGLEFMLLLVGRDLFFQEKNIKIYALIVFTSGHNKIVLILLNKLIIFYVRNTII